MVKTNRAVPSCISYRLEHFLNWTTRWIKGRLSWLRYSPSENPNGLQSQQINVVKEHLKRAQLTVETCCAKKSYCLSYCWVCLQKLLHRKYRERSQSVYLNDNSFKAGPEACSILQYTTILMLPLSSFWPCVPCGNLSSQFGASSRFGNPGE
jgi:hypothetical protein